MAVEGRAEPVEVHEHGESPIEHHPARPYRRDQAEVCPVLKAEDMHYALDHHVYLAGCEKHAQLQLRMAKDACEQTVEVPEIPTRGMRITWPRAETPTHYMTMGLHEDLNQAAKIATREMLNFIVETKGLSRDDVYMLLSAAMDLQVTQNVDITKGIHAMMPKAVFQK